MAVELNARTLLLEHLAGVLREMETVCIDLCDVAVLKKEGLKKMSLPEVDSAVKREATLVERLRNADDKRRLVFQQIAGVFGMDPETLTVKDLLPRLPDGPERVRQELELLVKLATPLMSTRGYAAPEVGRVFERAHALSR